MHIGLRSRVMAYPARTFPDEDRPREDHVIQLDGATWDDYERLLAIRGDRSAPRITYLEGLIEIMSPSFEHDYYKSVLGCLVETWCLEHGVRFMTVGSWTIKDRREDRGAEPDECYIFGTERKERPDLAIEVEWTHGGIDKLQVYRKLGVREVWYWRRGTIHVHLLDGDDYTLASASRALPAVDLEELASYVDRPTTFDAINDYREALRAKSAAR
jgi:Uma2 family endonuclease